jgi:hypothetical protein
VDYPRFTIVALRQPNLSYLYRRRKVSVSSTSSVRQASQYFLNHVVMSSQLLYHLVT